MIVHLPERWRQILTKMPEDGMGSQHVDIELVDGRIIRNVSVFNGEECRSSVDFDGERILRITKSRTLKN